MPIIIFLVHRPNRCTVIALFSNIKVTDVYIVCNAIILKDQNRLNAKTKIRDHISRTM